MIIHNACVNGNHLTYNEEGSEKVVLLHAVLLINYHDNIIVYECYQEYMKVARVGGGGGGDSIKQGISTVPSVGKDT